MFLSIHRQDCEFLSYQGNFDYSLLIGIHNKRLARESMERRRNIRVIFLTGIA